MNQLSLFRCWLPLLMVMCLGFGGCKSYQEEPSPSSLTSRNKAATKLASPETQQEWAVSSIKPSDDDYGPCLKAVVHLCSLLADENRSVEGGIFKRRLLAVPTVCREEIGQAFSQAYGEGGEATIKTDSFGSSACFIEMSNRISFLQ